MKVTLAALPLAAAGVAAAIHARAADAPWSAETIAGLLAQPGVSGLLALTGEAPQGFILCRVAADEAEVLTLAVLPEARRRGIARALVTAAMAQVTAGGAARLLLEVSVRNDAALALYRSVGFDEVGRRKDYYAESAGGGPADALVMATDLAPR
jgi:[ribosomal protein S18]-alanine N-acetyltransferase